MKVIDPLVTDTVATLTRASTATYWDYLGVLQTAAVNDIRVNWTRDTHDFQGVLVEPERTNLLLNNAALVTQTRTVVPGATYTLSFYGTGFIALSGASAGTMLGLGATVRTTLTFVAASSSLTLVPLSDMANLVQHAQLEEGAYATSVIVTTASPVTRSADVVTGTGVFYSAFTDSTPTYNAGTAYDFNDVVQYGIRKYKSLVAGVDTNTGNTPATPSDFWEDVGPTNTFAMFDRQVSLQSTGLSAEQYVMVKLPSAADSLALLNLDATSVHLIISDGASTFGSSYRDGSPASLVLTGATAGIYVTVSIKKTASVPKVGEFVCGLLQEVGATQYGLGMSMLDFSRKLTDEFGTTTFVERAFSKRMSCNVQILDADFNRTMDLLFSLRARPSVWIATDEALYSSGALIYGFLKDFRAVVEYYASSMYSLEIEGMI